MRRCLRLTLTLARKDWALFFADRRAAVMCLLVPIILASAFGLIFDRPAARAAATRLPILIVADDDSPQTRAIVHDLLDSPRLEAKLATREEAYRAVERRRVSVAVIVPIQTQSAIESKPTYELLYHPQAGLESQWAEGVLTEVLMRHAARDMLGPMLTPMLNTGTTQLPFIIDRHTPQPQAGPSFNAYSHSFAGMTLQYLLFWGMESGLLFLRERQGGIWRRMQTMPVSLGTLLLGRMLATAGIAMLQVILTFSVGWLIFGVQVTGSWTAFIALVVSISLLSAVTGLLVASLGGTEARARSVSILLILSISMLGGLWLPAFLLPDWVRQLSQTLPTTWAMTAFEGLLRFGHGWAAVLPALGMVLAFTIGFAGIAVARFQNIEQRQRRGWVR